MQVAQSFQVLPAVTDQANFYVSLQTQSAGRTGSLYSNPTILFNPSANTLTVSNLTVTSSFGLGTLGQKLSADNTTGAMGLIPAATGTYPSVTGLVLLPTGGLGIASVQGGQISASSYATAVSNATTTGAPIGSLVKVYNFIGTVTVGTGTVRWYPQSSVNLVMCYLTAGTAPTIGNFVINLNKNGALVQTITLVSGAYNTSPILLNVTAGTTDYFTVDVVNTGGSSNGALNIVYQRTS